MEEVDVERMKELVQKIDDADLCVTRALTTEERCELCKLMDIRIAEIEFGYPIYGE